MHVGTHASVRVHTVQQSLHRVSTEHTLAVAAIWTESTLYSSENCLFTMSGWWLPPSSLLRPSSSLCLSRPSSRRPRSFEPQKEDRRRRSFRLMCSLGTLWVLSGQYLLAVMSSWQYQSRNQHTVCSQRDTERHWDRVLSGSVSNWHRNLEPPPSILAPCSRTLLTHPRTRSPISPRSSHT